MSVFIRIFTYAMALLLFGCGAGPDEETRSDAFSSSVVKQDTSCLSIPATVPTATLSGTIQYERVPVKVNFAQEGLIQSQLSPADIVIEPAKGIRVQALSCTGDVIDETDTDDLGRYSFSLSDMAQARIRSIALTEQQVGESSWSVTVRDNTRSGEPVYAEFTELINLNQPSITHDILMSSGWGGVQFDQRRQSAPFAIIATIKNAMDVIKQEGVKLNYPPLTVYWSAKNRSVNKTDLRRGELTTSFYQNSSIYLLGHIATDSDDMDQHVIVHEWAHYIEDKFSRFDSIGGSHSIRSQLDPRVSFSEGFGNALSALLIKDSSYRDALGSEAQFLGGGFDLEADDIKSAPAIAGWYSEHSVQSLLYDLHDEQTEQEDETVSLGINRLFSVMMQEHKTTPALTTMVSFVDALLKQVPEQSPEIMPLLEQHKMEGVSDTWGTDDATLGNFVIDSHAPLYKVITEGQSSVCLNPNVQVYNGVATRRFYRFNKVRAGQAVINIEGPKGSAPSFRVWKSGKLVMEALSRTNTVRRIFNIDKGEFVLEATDYSVLNGQPLTVTECYTLNLTLN